MKFTKVVFGALLTGVAALSLTSCGGKDGNTVQFYIQSSTDNAPKVKTLADSFNASNDSEYKIEVVEIQGGYDGVKDAVKNDIQADKVPAMAIAYPDHVAEYLRRGVVQNLKPLIDNADYGFTAAQKEDIVPAFYAEGYEAFGVDGNTTMYTLPFSKSTEVMYYNKTQLQSIEKELGADFDLENIGSWTWDHFWSVCEQIKSSSWGKDKNNVPMGYDSESNFFITLDEQYGYDYTSATGSEKYLFNNQDNINMLTKLKEYKNKGLFTTQTILGTYTSDSFTKGNLLFSIGSSAGAVHQDPNGAFEAEVTGIPQKDPNNRKSINQGPSLVLFDLGDTEADNEKEVVAFKFAKELLSPEFQATYSGTSGYMPVVQSATETEYFQNEVLNSNTIISKTIKYATEHTDSYFVSPAFDGSNKARTQVGLALVAVIDTNKTAKDALQEAYDECTF